MIVCFAYLGTVCKKRVPSAHTVLEIIKMRYGKILPHSSIKNIDLTISRHCRSLKLHIFGRRE